MPFIVKICSILIYGSGLDLAMRFSEKFAKSAMQVAIKISIAPNGTPMKSESF